MPDPMPVRCAIYTRKSTEEGLQQDFNSLQAQREAAEGFILSQRQGGWTAIAEHYDDGGFSGASIDRPAMRKLLADVEAGLIDCVVVYKVDRLSRSLLDFARLIEMFDGRGVSFVSVTQDFNTRSSLGRLTLNILLSFAHYVERAIMQSPSSEVTVWLAFRSRGTPHYPGSNNEAISASGSSGASPSRGNCRRREMIFGLLVFPTRANECGVRRDTMSDHFYSFEMSPEQRRRSGVRGGRAYARKQRARRALLHTATGTAAPRLAAPPATIAESIAVLDACFPWLRGAEKRRS
jgi:Resolvase, N terminal domain